MTAVCLWPRICDMLKTETKTSSLPKLNFIYSAWRLLYRPLFVCLCDVYPISAKSCHLNVYTLLRVHHGVVAHFQSLEDLHVLDVEASEVLKRLHNGSLRRGRGRIVPFCHIQGVILDVHLRARVLIDIGVHLVVREPQVIIHTWGR